MRVRHAVAAASLFVLGATSAEAQGGVPELFVGIGALSYITSDGSDTFGIGINHQQLRYAFPLSASTMLEPTVTIGYLSNDGSSSTSIHVGAFLPIFFDGSPADGVYIAPGAGIAYSSIQIDPLPSVNFSQVELAFELGNKSRITEAVALRLAANVVLALENDDAPATTTINGILGLSVRLR